MKIFDYRAAIFYVKGHRNMKFTRKDLPPDQMKRANITTCLTVTMAYVFYILIMLTSDRTTLEKIIFVSFYVIWYALTAIFVAKNIYERKAELFIAVGFCIGFGIISFIVCIFERISDHVGSGCNLSIYYYQDGPDPCK